jgi:oxygen-dependent protoporphyrinogen oxidase
VLPDTLAAALGDDVRLNTPVARLAKCAAGWRVSSSRGEEEFGAAIWCGTAYRLAELPIDGARLAGQPPASDQPLALLAEIIYPPVASVVLGFRREDVAHPCQGFGMLIPRIEGFKILGTIFSSALFPNRAPAGHLTLTSYLGGARHPDLALRPAAELIETTLADLRVLLGVKGSPVFSQTATYPRAIPQYNLGYGKYRQLLNDMEAAAPGLYFAGHYRDGVSLGDSIVSGVGIAARVAEMMGGK